MDHQLDKLGERIADQAAHLDAAKHRLLADLREFDQRGGWHSQGAMSCAHWLSWRVGWDLVTARDHVRVARKLVEFAAIDDALRRGEVSYSKVRAMLRAATSDNETLLLEYAKLMTASQLEKLARKYAQVQRHGKEPQPLGDEQRRHVRRRDTEDGMVKIEAVLHPEEAEMVWTMLDHAATQLARSTSPCAATAAPESTDHAAASAAAVPPGGCNRCGSHDSAESVDPPSAPGTAASVSPTSAEATAACDSTANHDSAALPDTGSATSSVHAARCDPASEPAPRSLLDRLLDEADALRGVEEEVARAKPFAASSGEHVTNATRSALRQRADATRRAFNRADALVSLAQRYLRGDQPNRSPVEVTLTIAASGLRGDETDAVEVGEIGDSFVSGQTARRLACDAGLIEVVEDKHGVPLSVGRKRRTIEGALKRALYRRDKTCTYPGCTNRLFLEGHHLKHWADGGETSLSNTSLMCSLHHRFVHEYGFTVELGPDQRPRFRDPRGRLVVAVPEPPAVVELGWPQIRAMNEPLGITAGSIAGPWDGTPVDYGRIVGHLVVADCPGSRHR